jgi:hypothetical protein
MADRPFHESSYEQPREWWIQQAEIEHDRANRAERELAQHRSVGAWGRECALVALRMLARAGKLKATTDDERKVVEWAQGDPWLHAPGANRRLGSPFDDEYAASADAAARAVLVDYEQEAA